MPFESQNYIITQYKQLLNSNEISLHVLKNGAVNVFDSIHTE